MTSVVTTLEHFIHYRLRPSVDELYALADRLFMSHAVFDPDIHLLKAKPEPVTPLGIPPRPYIPPPGVRYQAGVMT